MIHKENQQACNIKGIILQHLHYIHTFIWSVISDKVTIFNCMCYTKVCLTGAELKTQLASVMTFVLKFFNYRPTSHQVWRTSPLIFEFTWGEMRRTQSECYARKVAFMFVSPAYWAFVWGAADVDSKQSCFKWAKFDTGVIDVWSFQWNIDQVETLNQGTLKVLKLRFILCWNGR